MAPPQAATARRVASSVGRPIQEPARGTPRRPPLKVVPTGRGAATVRSQGHHRGQHRLLTLLSVAMVVGALLVVVVGHAMLANGQVRMAGIEHQLTLEQSAHHQIELQVAQLQTPSRIVAAALGEGQMVHPSSVIELPYVSLTTPLATPTVTPVPAATTSTTTPAP
jgi:cell division protein FtsL